MTHTFQLGKAESFISTYGVVCEPVPFSTENRNHVAANIEGDAPTILGVLYHSDYMGPYLDAFTGEELGTEAYEFDDDMDDSQRLALMGYQSIKIDGGMFVFKQGTTLDDVFIRILEGFAENAKMYSLELWRLKK